MNVLALLMTIFHNLEEFKARVEQLCHVYAEAAELAAAGVQVHSTDEMTGIQAREHTHAPHRMRPASQKRSSMSISAMARRA